MMALPSSGGTDGPEVWRSKDGGLYARLSDGRVVNLATGQFYAYVPPMSQRIAMLTRLLPFTSTGT